MNKSIASVPFILDACVRGILFSRGSY